MSDLFRDRLRKPEYKPQAQRKQLAGSECQRMQNAVNAANRNAETYLDGFYGMRRQKAILNFMDRAAEDFKKRRLLSVAESFVQNELLPFSNYNHLDENNNIFIGAALQILEKLRLSGHMSKAYRILPDVTDDFDAFYLPTDFSHPCFANDLIQSVIHVLMNRYGPHGGVITEGNAQGKKPSDDYEQLMSLLPQDDVKKACIEFRERVWVILTRYMKGKAYYDAEVTDADSNKNNFCHQILAICKMCGVMGMLS